MLWKQQALFHPSVIQTKNNLFVAVRILSGWSNTKKTSGLRSQKQTGKSDKIWPLSYELSPTGQIHKSIFELKEPERARLNQPSKNISIPPEHLLNQLAMFCEFGHGHEDCRLFLNDACARNAVNIY